MLPWLVIQLSSGVVTVATADVVCQVRPDVDTITVSPDVGVIAVRPDTGL